MTISHIDPRNPLSIHLICLFCLLIMYIDFFNNTYIK
jgi:hypothetical protein